MLFKEYNKYEYVAYYAYMMSIVKCSTSKVTSPSDRHMCTAPNLHNLANHAMVYVFVNSTSNDPVPCYVNIWFSGGKIKMN